MSSTKPLSNWVLFGAAILLGIFIVLSYAGYQKWTRPPPFSPKHLHANLWVTEQIKLETIPTLKNLGYTAIIDLRPDNETVGQANSKEVESMARAIHINFNYVPVPHGDIPDRAVTELGQALADKSGEVLLYCRSGRRAARTWSLLEASRPNGLNTQAILAAVKESGQSADDLESAIEQRIRQRNNFEGKTE